MVPIGDIGVRSCSLRLVVPVLVLLLPTPEVSAETHLTDGDAIAPPIPAGLDQVLDASPTAWRSPDLEVYRWDRFPDILVIDTSRLSRPGQDVHPPRLFRRKEGIPREASQQRPVLPGGTDGMPTTTVLKGLLRSSMRRCTRRFR